MTLNDPHCENNRSNICFARFIGRSYFWDTSSVPFRMSSTFPEENPVDSNPICIERASPLRHPCQTVGDKGGASYMGKADGGSPVGAWCMGGEFMWQKNANVPGSAWWVLPDDFICASSSTEDFTSVRTYTSQAPTSDYSECHDAPSGCSYSDSIKNPRCSIIYPPIRITPDQLLDPGEVGCGSVRFFSSCCYWSGLISKGGYDVNGKEWQDIDGMAYAEENFFCDSEETSGLPRINRGRMVCEEDAIDIEYVYETGQLVSVPKGINGECPDTYKTLGAYKALEYGIQYLECIPEVLPNIGCLCLPVTGGVRENIVGNVLHFQQKCTDLFGIWRPMAGCQKGTCGVTFCKHENTTDPYDFNDPPCPDIPSQPYPAPYAALTSFDGCVSRVRPTWTGTDQANYSSKEKVYSGPCWPCPALYETDVSVFEWTPVENSVYVCGANGTIIPVSNPINESCVSGCENPNEKKCCEVSGEENRHLENDLLFSGASCFDPISGQQTSGCTSCCAYGCNQYAETCEPDQYGMCIMCPPRGCTANTVCNDLVCSSDPSCCSYAEQPDWKGWNSPACLSLANDLCAICDTPCPLECKNYNALKWCADRLNPNGWVGGATRGLDLFDAVMLPNTMPCSKCDLPLCALKYNCNLDCPCGQYGIRNSDGDLYCSPTCVDEFGLWGELAPNINCTYCPTH